MTTGVDGPDGSSPGTRPAPYEPPRQPVRGQLLDAATVLVLIFVTLFVTTLLSSEESDEQGPTGPGRPLSELPLTRGERAQYQKMIDTGTADLPTISAGVAENRPSEDKYEIDIAALVGTAVLLAVYLGFVYRVSFREYREVIDEKFGPGEGGGTP